MVTNTRQLFVLPWCEFAKVDGEYLGAATVTSTAKGKQVAVELESIERSLNATRLAR